MKLVLDTLNGLLIVLSNAASTLISNIKYVFFSLNKIIIEETSAHLKGSTQERGIQVFKKQFSFDKKI